MKAATEDYIMTLFIIGESGVGKTTIISQFIEKVFRENAATVSIDLFTTNIQVDGRTIKLKIWDTPGDVKYRSIVKQSFQNVCAVFLAYDITEYICYQH